MSSIEQKLNFITAKIGVIGEIGSKIDIEETKNEINGLKQFLIQVKDEQTNLRKAFNGLQKQILTE